MTEKRYDKIWSKKVKLIISVISHVFKITRNLPTILGFAEQEYLAGFSSSGGKCKKVELQNS